MRTLTTLLALTLLAAQAQAGAGFLEKLASYQQPNIHIGQLAIHPYYKLAETYDSNIYLVPNDQPGGVVTGGGKRESWITKNNLGIEAVLPWHQLHKLELGYDFESQIYTTQPDVNNAINQEAHLDYTYAGGYGLTVKAGDRYVNTTDQAFSELIQRQRRWSNRGYASLDYSPENGRLAAGLDVSQKNDKYLDPTFANTLNRYDQQFGFNIGYKVQPKTKVYVAYTRGIIHYEVPPTAGTLEKDNKSHTVSVGVKGQLAQKLEGQVEAGMTYREYDKANIAGFSRIKRSPMVATAVTWRPEPYTAATLTLSRYIEESIDPTNPYYVDNDALLTLKHRFPYKVTAGAKAELTIDSYSNRPVAGGPVRRDDIYQGGIWVEYEMQKWLSTGLAYLYRQRCSTLSSQFNYDDHQLTWNAALKF